MTAVNDLLSDLTAGRKTLDEVAVAFRNRTWPAARPSGTDDTADPDPMDPDSFDAVSAAYMLGALDDDTYAVLANAAAGSAKTSETKAAVRHVRTSEGSRKYGQAIGTVITRDIIEAAKRRRAHGSAATTSRSPVRTEEHFTAARAVDLYPREVVDTPRFDESGRRLPSEERESLARERDRQQRRAYERGEAPLVFPVPRYVPDSAGRPRKLSSEEREQIARQAERIRRHEQIRLSDQRDREDRRTVATSAARSRSGPAPPIPGRFADLDAVKAHLRAGGDHPGGKDTTFLTDLADNPTLIASPGRSLVATRSGRDWWISTSGSGLSINRMAEVSWGGKPAVLALMGKLEAEIQDTDGKPFPWDAPDVAELTRTWRSDRGESIGAAAQRVTAEHDIAGGHPDTTVANQHRRATRIGEMPEPPAEMRIIRKDEPGELGTILWATGTPIEVLTGDGTALPGVIAGRGAGGSVVRWADDSYSVVDPKKLIARTDATGVEDDPGVRFYLDETAKLRAKLDADQAAHEAALRPYSLTRNRAIEYENAIRADKIEIRKYQGGLARAIAKAQGATEPRPAPDPEPQQPTITPSIVGDDGVIVGVRAVEVEPGDHVLLPDVDGNAQPAEVTRVGIDSFGDFSLDYRIGGPDEGEQTIALDPDEVVQRVSGDVGPITPDPSPERDADVLSATTGDVRPGDRLATNGAPLLVIARRRDRATGLIEVTTTDDKGHRDSGFYPESWSFELASHGADPDPLSEETATARPVLATYQRRAIAALDLEGSDNGVLAQAAIRVRAKQALSVAQVAALSTELRQRAGLEQRPTRKRSLARVSAQLGATVTELGGEFTPGQVEQTGAVKTSAADLTEGDQVAIGVPDGMLVGRVLGIRAVMGGRLTELTVEDETGVHRQVMLTRTAPVYRLPDVPPPVPVPEDPPVPEPVREYSDLRMAEIQGFLARDLGRSVRGEVMALAITYPEGPDGLESIVRALRSQRDHYREGKAETDNQGLIAVLAPDLSLQDRRDLASIARTVTDHLRSDYYDRLAGGLVDWPEDPSYSNRGILEQVVAATPPPDLTEVSRSLAIASHDLTQARREAIGYRPPNGDQKQEVRDAVTALFQAQRQEYAARLTSAVQGKSKSAAKAAMTRIGNRGDGVEPSDALVQQMMEQLSYGADPINIPSVRERLRQQLRAGNERLRSRAAVDIELAGINGRTRDPVEAIRISAAELDNLQDGWSGADWFEASQIAEFAQIKLAEGGEGGRPVEVDIPVLPPPVAGQSLSDRISQLRAALPQNGAGFGTRTFHTTTFGPTSVADLEQGRTPEIISGETTRPDVDLTDGGPGAVALRHLEVVKEAGRTLNAEVARRMAERTDQFPDYVPGHFDAAQRRTEETWVAYTSAQKKHKDGVAKVYGYKSYADMVKTMNALELRRKTRPDDEELRKNFLWATHGVRAAEGDTEELAAMMETRRTAWLEYKAADQIEQPRRALYSLTVREVLSEIRELGSGDGASISFDLALDDEKTEAAHEAMRWAVEFYPRDWVRKHPDPIVLKTTDRGYSTAYNAQGRPEIALSKKRDMLGVGGLRGEYSAVAVHELGHQMEHRVPDLAVAESVFLWSRTSVGPVGARERTGKNAPSPIFAGRKTEQGRKDRFRNHYSGKEYFGASFELFTTGVEDMLGGNSGYVNDDEEYRDFVLGTMAVL